MGFGAAPTEFYEVFKELATNVDFLKEAGEGRWLKEHAASKALKDIEARIAKLVAN